MMRKTGGTAKTSVLVAEELAFREGPMAALEAEAQAAAEQAEAEGRNPGQGPASSPIPSRASSPHHHPAGSR